MNAIQRIELYPSQRSTINWKFYSHCIKCFCSNFGHRNVLKATIEIPKVGELNFHCTHLDHLDENWRMKQISAILRSSNEPHILVGGLNSLDESDYSAERWSDIVKVKKIKIIIIQASILSKESILGA